MNIENLKNVENDFEKAIADYLLDRISVDGELLLKLTLTEKTLHGCISYIISKAREVERFDSCAVVSDDKVFNWVVHYFMEDSILEQNAAHVKKQKKDVKVQVVKSDNSVKKNMEQLSLFDEV